MIGGLGMQELLIIFAIVLLLFGGKKLPELGKGLGKAIRGFKEAEEETVTELKRAAEGELSDKPKGDGATEEQTSEGAKGEEATEEQASEETKGD